MSARVKIVGPFATAADTAKALGVSPARQKQLEHLVDGLLSEGKRRPRGAALKSHQSAVLRKRRSPVNGKSSSHGNDRQRQAPE
jgi:hypothetical protein